MNNQTKIVKQPGQAQADFDQQVRDTLAAIEHDHPYAVARTSDLCLIVENPLISNADYIAKVDQHAGGI